MIANIRIRDGSSSRSLCQLNLMQFSEEQIRDRMLDRGIRNDTFVICGFVDWDVDTEMSLELAYALKRHILTFYDGDEDFVAELLRRHIPAQEVIKHCYSFISSSEEEAIAYLLKYTNVGQLMLAKAIQDRVVIPYRNGFYFADDIG